MHLRQSAPVLSGVVLCLGPGVNLEFKSWRSRLDAEMEAKLKV